MNQTQNSFTAPVAIEGEEKVKIIDLLIVLAKHKKIVIGGPILATIIAIVVSFSLSPTYRADTTLLPPQQGQSSAMAILSQLGGAAGAVAGAAGLKNPSDVYIGILKSRLVGDALVKRFSLQDVYELPSAEQARRKLEESTQISAGKEGMLQIVVEDLDGARAAQMANAYVDELEKVTRKLAVTQAAQKRLFYEQQLQLSKTNLASAEVALKGALSEHGVVSVDSDSKALMETIVRLRAQISAKEIQLSSMSAFVTANNVEFKKAQQELISLRAQLNQLENGAGGKESSNVTGSQQAFESVKLLRDVKYHQMLYELLAKQYEMARLEEANDPMIIQVLDPAVKPERKFKPRRGVIIVLTALTSLLLVSVFAFVWESYTAQGAGGEMEKWKRLRNYLRFTKAQES